LTRILKYYILLIFFIVIQNTFIWLIAVSDYNINPDLVLIGVVLIGVKRGKIEGMISGFFAGLILDIMAGYYLGLLALIYTLSGFASGFFQEFKERDIVLPKKYFVVIMAVIGFFANLFYFEIFFLTASSGHSFIEIIFTFVLPTTLYTLLISMIYVLIPTRKPLNAV